jgi:SRSO17 transposase
VGFLFDHNPLLRECLTVIVALLLAEVVALHGEPPVKPVLIPFHHWFGPMVCGDREKGKAMPPTIISVPEKEEDVRVLDEAKARLEEFLGRIGQALGHKGRVENFAIYVTGLLARLERKNGETIAAAAAGPDAAPSDIDAIHQRLLHVIGQSKWKDATVRAEAERYAMEALPDVGGVSQLIIDDTGWLKQGSHSVGVQRQYTGSAGKLTNCQVGVSVVAATKTSQLPLDFALYLPEKWLTPDMRLKAKIPKDVAFKTKPQLALDLLETVRSRGAVPLCRVSADSAYGNSSAFRQAVLDLGHGLAVGVQGSTNAWSVDRDGHRRGPVTHVESIAARLRYKRISWREGTQGRLSGEFGARRVVPQRDYEDFGTVDPFWLLVEKDPPQSLRDKFAFITAPADTAVKDLVLIWKERYRTERVYQDSKENLGLDHYQGRSYRGWHHHVSAVLVCGAFLFAEQCRRPRPQGRRDAVRTSMRFERHFPDSIATLHRMIARGLLQWLPGALVPPAALLPDYVAG